MESIVELSNPKMSCLRRQRVLSFNTQSNQGRLLRTPADVLTPDSFVVTAISGKETLLYCKKIPNAIQKHYEEEGAFTVNLDEFDLMSSNAGLKEQIGEQIDLRKKADWVGLEWTEDDPDLNRCRTAVEGLLPVDACDKIMERLSWSTQEEVERLEGKSQGRTARYPRDRPSA